MHRWCLNFMSIWTISCRYWFAYMYVHNWSCLYYIVDIDYIISISNHICAQRYRVLPKFVQGSPIVFSIWCWFCNLHVTVIDIVVGLAPIKCRYRCRYLILYTISSISIDNKVGPRQVLLIHVGIFSRQKNFIFFIF